MLHPEIKKFWEKYGIVNCIDEPTSHIKNVPFYYISKKSGGTETIAIPVGNELAYFFGGKCFYEEDMLRVIKLKAFI